MKGIVGRMKLAAPLSLAALIICMGAHAQGINPGFVTAKKDIAIHDSAIHKIKHVVIIMQENRSFDTYGTFPGVDGSQ